MNIRVYDILPKYAGTRTSRIIYPFCYTITCDKVLKLFFLLLTILISKFCTSQCLTIDERSSLQGIVFNTFDKHQRENKIMWEDSSRTSELVLVFLDIDSLGHANDVRLLAEKPSKYSLLYSCNILATSDFSTFKSRTCKSKSILIPIISISANKIPNYVETFRNASVLQPGEFGDLIILRGISLWGMHSKE